MSLTPGQIAYAFVDPPIKEPSTSSSSSLRFKFLKKASTRSTNDLQSIHVPPTPSDYPAPPDSHSPLANRSSKKHQKSLSARALASSKRLRADSAPASPVDDDHGDFDFDLQQTPTPAWFAASEARADSAISSGLGALEGGASALQGNNPLPRPKHIPIVIPNYVPINGDQPADPSDSFSTYFSSASDSPNVSFSEFPAAPGSRISAGSSKAKSRHVEIRIPSWAQPVLKQPSTPPKLRLTHSVFADPFADIKALSPPDDHDDHNDQTPGPIVSATMDGPGSTSSAHQFYEDQSQNGSQSHLLSAHSSQSSLVGMRAEYESASESESTHDDAETGSHTPSQARALTPATADAAAAASSANAAANSVSNLNGLVCNVHRTTGREPHPLVGATTTILGDKLYVFGGRRLSRSRPQLTSTLYELDLVRRHWTKVDTKGDIPPPRYFHSVCPLGDSKLVCYGGMSPAVASEQDTDTQAEVVVMSDIHIYDAPTRTWMKISTPDAPQGRYAHCAAILPSSAVFASPNAPMSAVHHNPSGAHPNQGTLGVSIDGTGGAEMVVVGGQDSANHYIEQISVFNLRNLKWTSTMGMGRSCGAYRSVVTPLTSMSASQIGAGPHSQMEDDDDEDGTVGSGSPMLIYSNYNFLDVKLELQVRLTDGTLTEKPMQTDVSPPGLRFPNGGIIANHFVVSGTFLTSSKQEYALWALDLRTLTWSRIDAGGGIFSQGSWNRGVLWSRRNAFVILGNRKRSLVDDYNNRRINFSNICLVELEAFGLYDNPRIAEPFSAYVSASAGTLHAPLDTSASGRQLTPAAEELGSMCLGVPELADMEFLAIDGTRIPVNSRLIARRWGQHFNNLLKESLATASDTDTATLRPTGGTHPSRNSSITITPSVNSTSTTVTSNSAVPDVPDPRSAPPPARQRLFYLPHTVPTLQALLHFLYTSTLPSAPSPLATPQILCSLLQLARPYHVDGLLEAVVQRLHESLDGRNAAAIFNAAAMAAGGGEGVQFASTNSGVREGTIPLRTASLANMDSLTINGVTRSAAALRIDTEMANGRNARNTLRPGQSLSEETDEDDVPGSAHTDASLSESETSLSARSLTGMADRQNVVWNGAMSAVVGLQKRGLRGLMEGRRMRERGRSEVDGARMGLGIA